MIVVADAEARAQAHCGDIARTARLAGLVYLLFALLSIFSFAYVPSALTVSDDAAATAEAIRSAETLFRLGVLGALTSMVLFIVLVVTLYEVLGSAGSGLARLMVSLVLVGVAAEFFSITLRLGALALLKDADVAVSGADPDVLAYAVLDFQGEASSAIQLFWGLWLFPFGALLIRSRIAPSVLGFLVLAAGVGYTVSGVLAVVAPDVRSALTPLLTPLAAGELPIIIWLLVRGASQQASGGATH